MGGGVAGIPHSEARRYLELAPRFIGPK
jgi:hypothetical protein